MATIGILADVSGQLINLFSKDEPQEILGFNYYLSTNFQSFGRIYKVDGLNIVDNRTDMSYRWKVYCNEFCLTSYATEAEADTFIRKLRDAINTKEGSNRIKRAGDI